MLWPGTEANTPKREKVEGQDTGSQQQCGNKFSNLL